MKTRFMLLVLCALPLSNILGATETQPEGSAAGPVMLISLLLLIFFGFKVLGPVKMKTNKKAVVQQLTLADLALIEVGQLNQVGEHTRFASKLVQKQGDVETFLMVAQIDKSHVRKEVQQEQMQKKSKSLNGLLMFFGGIAFMLLVMMLFS